MSLSLSRVEHEGARTTVEVSPAAFGATAGMLHTGGRGGAASLCSRTCFALPYMRSPKMGEAIFNLLPLLNPRDLVCRA